jgi:hypothetical protein
VSGYLLVWGVFSLIATVAQWGLASAGLVDAMMRGNSLWFAGLLLIAAVLYQMTPIKDACLRHCQSPIQFVMRNWQTGTIGALKMLLTHGVYCLGCCGAMMMLLFVGGMMNIIWIGGLAIFVLIEKQAARWPHFNKITSAGLVAQCQTDLENPNFEKENTMAGNERIASALNRINEVFEKKPDAGLNTNTCKVRLTDGLQCNVNEGSASALVDIGEILGGDGAGTWTGIFWPHVAGQLCRNRDQDSSRSRWSSGKRC